MKERGFRMILTYEKLNPEAVSSEDGG